MLLSGSANPSAPFFMTWILSAWLAGIASAIASCTNQDMMTKALYERSSGEEGEPSLHS